MPRFFAELEDADSAVITGGDARHIQGPLRKKIGDELSVRDRVKGYMARITSISPQKIGLKITSSQELYERGTTRVHLGMSLIDMKDMDLLIRAVTELGVTGMHPLIAERSNIRTVSDSRRDRWNTIVTEAVKQCERRVIPRIHEPLPLKDFIHSPVSSWEMRVVASQGAEVPLHECRAQETCVLIGPEGGFSPAEM